MGTEIAPIELSGPPTDQRWLSFDQFRFFPAFRRVYRGDEEIRLRGREVDLLKGLIERAGKFITNDDLMQIVWPTSTVSESNLRVQIASLRRALGDNGTVSRIIVNVTGRGYCLVSPVKEGVGDRLPRPQEESTASFATVPVTVSVPYRFSVLIGRDAALARLQVHLRHRRMITVIGSGGIGKTSLVLALAEHIKETFDKEVFFVDLASIMTENLFVSAVCVGLNLRVEGPDALASTLEWLSERKALIILDNCEHVLGAAASFVEAALKRAPDLSILCTSREALRVEDEWVQRLQALEFPTEENRITAAEALSYAAVELFVDRATACLDAFELTDENATEVGELCRKLAGIPLAIELAAARVDRMGLGTILAMLPEKFDLLGSGKRTAKPHQQTLRTTLDWSYRLLNEREKTTLNRLAIFRNGFTIEAAVVVLRDPDSDEIELIDTVFELVGKSLVFVETTDLGDYYRLLETTRMYAAEKLEHSGELGVIKARHAEFCLSLMATARDTWAANNQRSWVSAFGRWMDDVTAALDWAYTSGDITLGIQLAALSAPLAGRLARLRDYMSRITFAVDKVHALDPRNPGLEIQLLAELCYLIFHTEGGTREYELALKRYDELIEEFPEAATQSEQLKFQFGRCFFETNFEKGLEVADRLREIATNLGNEADLLVSERMRSQSLNYLGKHTECITAAEFVIRASQYTPPTPEASARVDVRVSSRIAMARAMAIRGEIDDALDVLNDALEIADTYRNHPLCQTLVMGAIPIAIWRGNSSDRIRYNKALKEAAAEAGMELWATWARHIDTAIGPRQHMLSKMKIDDVIRDDLVTFSRHALDARVLEKVKSGGARWAASEVIRGEALNQLFSARIDRDSAARDFGRAIKIARTQGAALWELRAANDLASLRLAEGDPETARSLLGPLLDRLLKASESTDYRRGVDLFNGIVSPSDL